MAWMFFYISENQLFIITRQHVTLIFFYKLFELEN